MPEEPLEAALLDTRSGWQRFRFVILPMLRPAIIIVLIFRTMIALRAFAAIFSATGGEPRNRHGDSEFIRIQGIFQFAGTRLRGGTGNGFTADNGCHIPGFFQNASCLLRSIEEKLNHDPNW